jgi:hypothetical protein
MILDFTNKVFVFFFFLFLFACFYYYNSNSIDFQQAIFISTSYQTLCGTSIDKYEKKIHRIATLQMIISYLIIANIAYTFFHISQKNKNI